MQIQVKNIKISVKVPNAKSLPEIVVSTKRFYPHFVVKQFNNFVQLSDSESSLRISFFKSRCFPLGAEPDRLDSNTNISHINITGVVSWSDKDRALSITAAILERSSDELCSRVDCITASSCLGEKVFKPLQLSSLVQSFNHIQGFSARYNPETFTGLCLYHIRGCTIVYSSGALLIIGRTSEEDCEYLANIVERRIIELQQSYVLARTNN